MMIIKKLEEIHHPVSLSFYRKSYIPNNNSDFDFLNTEQSSNDFTWAPHLAGSKVHDDNTDEDKSSTIFSLEEQRYISGLNARKRYVPKSSSPLFSDYNADYNSMQRSQQHQENVDYNRDSVELSTDDQGEPHGSSNFNDFADSKVFEHQPGGDQIQSSMFPETPTSTSEQDSIHDEDEQQRGGMMPINIPGSKRDETGRKRHYQQWPLPQSQMLPSPPFPIPFPLSPLTNHAAADYVPVLQRARTNEALQQLKSDAFNHMERMLDVNITKTSELIKKKKKRKLTKAEKAKLEAKWRQEKFQKLYHPDENEKKESSLENKKLENHPSDNHRIVKNQTVGHHSTPSIMSQHHQQDHHNFPHQQQPQKAKLSNSNDNQQQEQEQDPLLQDSMKSLDDGWDLDLDSDQQNLEKDEGEEQHKQGNFNGPSPIKAMGFPSGFPGGNDGPFSMNPFLRQQQEVVPMFKHQPFPTVTSTNEKQAPKVTKTVKKNRKATTTNRNINKHKETDGKKQSGTNAKKNINSKPKPTKAKIEENNKSAESAKLKFQQQLKSTTAAKIIKKNATTTHSDKTQQNENKSDEFHTVQKSTLEENNSEKEQSIKKLIEKLDAAENAHSSSEEAAANTRQDTPGMAPVVLLSNQSINQDISLPLQDIEQQQQQHDTAMTLTSSAIPVSNVAASQSIADTLTAVPGEFKASRVCKPGVMKTNFDGKPNCLVIGDSIALG